jgi:hypothetical protein
MAQGLDEVSQTLGQYGDFVVTRQLVVEQNTIIYRARKHDAPPVEEAEKYVVVLFRSRREGSPAADESDPPAASLEKALQLNFLEVAKQQKKAHESGALNIVPVHDVGILPAGVWYATDYYPRGFLKKWISQRAGVSEAELRHIIDSTVRSLQTLQQHCGRSHGNLVPSSILIGGKIGGSLKDAPIMLTYLAPGEAKDANSFEVADLRALGLIIFTLVCRQNIAAFNPDHYPIPHSEAWSELGKTGDFWLRLCNRLLDPALDLEKYSLGKLASELVSLESKPALPLTAIGAGLAMVALLVIALGYYWMRTPKPAPTAHGPSAALEPPLGLSNAIAAGKQEPSGSAAGKTGHDDPGQPPPADTPATFSPLPDPTIQPAYAPPTLTGIGDWSVKLGTPIVQFPFQVGPNEEIAERLFVVSASANPVFLPDRSIKIEGRGTHRLLTINPVPQQTGEVILAVSAADSQTNATKSFWFRVTP